MTQNLAADSGIEILGDMAARFDEIVNDDALAFVADLHRTFEDTRRRLLAARADRQEAWDAGGLPDFLPETKEIRESDWKVGPISPICRTGASRLPDRPTGKW